MTLKRPSDDKLDACEELLGVTFRDRDLLVWALTHGSAKTQIHTSNERLEFLGDAILGMVVSSLLFADYPEHGEGRMTKIKAQAVSRESLFEVAEEIELRRFVIVGKMFLDRDGISDSILSDAVEALIAAIYLDRGFDAAIDFVVRHFKPVLRTAAEAPGLRDYKSKLGQWAQKKYGVNPEYRLESASGPDHELTFHITVLIEDRELAEATGMSKKAAEQEAARLALEAVERP